MQKKLFGAKNFSEYEKDNLIIESKEHLMKKGSKSKNLISHDIQCIKEKEDDDEDNLS